MRWIKLKTMVTKKIIIKTIIIIIIIILKTKKFYQVKILPNILEVNQLV